MNRKRTHALCVAVLAVLAVLASASAADSLPRCDEVFQTAIVTWHMADPRDHSGKNELRIVGAVALGVRLEEEDLRDSLESGNDGLVARLEGGYLDAGQGDGGMLNPTGSALTVSVRLRSPSGAWAKPLCSKHGGHDRLVYNLFSFADAIGFELGTRDFPGMTQVLVPLAKIGLRDWHDVICRYDGKVLQMFVDGVLVSEASAEGPLRGGNTEPCLIGAESYEARVLSGWEGLIDHAAIWGRALSDAEIERLSGGAARVAARKLTYPKARPAAANTRSFTADKRYLILPSNRGRTGQNRVSISVDGKPYLVVSGALITSSEPDHWRFVDLKLMQGKTLSVRIEGPDAAAIDMVNVSDSIPGKYPVYQEPGRPQVHFSPLRGSFNDPSGMIYHEGRWHLYYANKRFYNDSGNLNSLWGHATSTDLIHWEEQPIFLSAVDGQYSFWTGGAAVDVENTTGLGEPGKPAIVYSANNGAWGPSPFTQCVFVSTDGGMTARWDPEMMYKPLPKEDARRGGGTRDPMILWYTPEKKWVMVVYNQPPGGRNGFYFFESRDLRSWSEMSVLEDMYECPNFFQMPVDGDKADMRWVAWGSPTEYLIGKFDGRVFLPDDHRRQRVNHGAFSASQVFADAPEGRIVQIGWAHPCDYDGEFSRMAAFPLDLTLRKTPGGLRLYANFIPELAKLRKTGTRQVDAVVRAGAPLQVGDISQPAEIIAEFDPGTASRVSLTGAELDIVWDAQGQELEVHGEKTRLDPRNNRVALHILLDIPSVEVVGGAGESYTIVGRDYRKLGEKSPLEVRCEGGGVTFSRLEFYPLESIHAPQSFECPKVDKPYLHIPIRVDAPEVRLLVMIDGELQHPIDVKLAQDNPDWNGTFCVQKWTGKRLTIVPEKPLAESSWIRNLKMSDQLSDEDSVYKERYRPQFHFSPRRGCITDLDGPIYYNGEYHIFPGHRPWQLNGNAGSNPLWGHAVSRDLIHWEELGTAVTANKLGSPWSGSTAIDWYNTAGFVKNPVKDGEGRLKNPAVVAIYTNGHGGRSVPEPTQSLNYSLDSGRTWIEYPGNPVMPFVAVYNRDPKIVWYEDKANRANSHWAVVLLLDGPNSSIWTSRDMVHWERSQTLDNIDVCPDCADFYEIALDGDPNNKRWILWFGDGNYNVGTFDGETFKKEMGPIKSKTERTPGDRDRNIHIAQTFTGIPAEDGRRIQMGWILGNPKSGPQFPGMPFAGQYTLPHVLTLRTTPDGPRLFFEPAKELEKLRTGVSARMPKTTLDGTSMLLKEDRPLGELVEVNAVFTVRKDVMAQPGENILGLVINGQTVTCNLDTEQMIGNDGYQPLKAIDGQLKLRVFVDRTVVESFAAGVPWAPLVFPFLPANRPIYGINVFGKKGLADVEAKVYQLQSIWTGR